MTEQNENVTANKVWFITGAGRGMGTDIAKPPWPPATRSPPPPQPRNVTRVIGENENLPTVNLDVTDPAAAESAVQDALDRFGRIDAVVNNAGNFYAGFFEKSSRRASGRRHPWRPTGGIRRICGAACPMKKRPIKVSAPRISRYAG